MAAEPAPVPAATSEPAYEAVPEPAYDNRAEPESKGVSEPDDESGTAATSATGGRRAPQAWHRWAAAVLAGALAGVLVAALWPDGESSESMGKAPVVRAELDVTVHGIEEVR